MTAAIQSIIATVVQVVLTAVIAWLLHKLSQARMEFRQFMGEHKFLLETAKANSAAILKLNNRLDRLAKRRGPAL